MECTARGPLLSCDRTRYPGKPRSYIKMQDRAGKVTFERLDPNAFERRWMARDVPAEPELVFAGAEEISQRIRAAWANPIWKDVARALPGDVTGVIEREVHAGVLAMVHEELVHRHGVAAAWHTRQMRATDYMSARMYFGLGATPPRHTHNALRLRRVDGG